MNIEKIKKIVQIGESDQAEFKKSTGVLMAAIETVCAFLNGKGGTLLIGVTDSGKIIGQDVSDHSKQEIASHIAKIEPPAQSLIEIKYVPIENGKQVIVLTVNAGNHIPYVYDGRAFYRNQSSTWRMQQHRYEQLIVERGQLNHSWEEFPANQDYDITSLDHEEIYRTIEQGIRFNRIPVEAREDNVKNLLVRLELFKNERLLNSAVVLFGKKLFPAYAQCLIKLARFRGLDKLSDFSDGQQIYGNVFKVLSETNSFLMRHLPIASFFQEGKLERIDKPALPVLAVREALINAICHRNYSDTSSAITLSIFDDHLEIWSYGTLLPKLKIENLKKKHQSYLRNKLISQVFYNRGLIEKWGTGINKMIAFCKEDGLPEPEFEEYSGGFAVIFRFKELIGVSIKNSITKSELNTRQEAILAIIKRHRAVNIQQIIAELESPPSRTIIKKDLDHLKKQGFIELKGVARSSMWILK